MSEPAGRPPATEVSETIGNTPMAVLGRVGETERAEVLAKLEYMNPGGSVKDRIAVRMIDAAEAERAGLVSRVVPGGVSLRSGSIRSNTLVLSPRPRIFRCSPAGPPSCSKSRFAAVLSLYWSAAFSKARTDIPVSRCFLVIGA